MVLSFYIILSSNLEYCIFGLYMIFWLISKPEPNHIARKICVFSLTLQFILVILCKFLLKIILKILFHTV